MGSKRLQRNRDRKRNLYIQNKHIHNTFTLSGKINCFSGCNKLISTPLFDGIFICGLLSFGSDSVWCGGDWKNGRRSSRVNLVACLLPLCFSADLSRPHSYFMLFSLRCVSVFPFSRKMNIMIWMHGWWRNGWHGVSIQINLFIFYTLYSIRVVLVLFYHQPRTLTVLCQLTNCSFGDYLISIVLSRSSLS